MVMTEVATSGVLELVEIRGGPMEGTRLDLDELHTAHGVKEASPWPQVTVHVTCHSQSFSLAPLTFHHDDST